MKSYAFQHSEYDETMREWWTVFHGKPIDRRLLSKQGVVVRDAAGEPCAIAYIYPTLRSNVAWIGFTCRNPGITGYKAGKALKLLLTGCEITIKSLGYTIAYATYDAAPLHKLAERSGFSRASDVVEFFKELK